MNGDSGEKPGSAASRTRFLDSAAFARKKYRHDWLIRNIMVARQPMVIGGAIKTLKTSSAIDMAISLGSGTSFLGTFAVPERRRVAVLSGESGPATIQETALRICAAKGTRLKDCTVHWSFALPRLGSDADCEALDGFLREARIEVVILDPLYLLLGGEGASASNLYEIGPLLYRAGRTCQAAGATLVLVHHATKGAIKASKADAPKPLALEDLAFAGIGEYARQWLLLSRRQPYQDGSGDHELLMHIGGSAGHSGCWEVDVHEGVLGEGLEGREWCVKVRRRGSKDPSRQRPSRLPGG